MGIVAFSLYNINMNTVFQCVPTELDLQDFFLKVVMGYDIPHYLSRHIEEGREEGGVSPSAFGQLGSEVFRCKIVVLEVL